MSISLNANFELLSAGLYLDARQQFNTIIEMKDFAETSIPDGFITYNKETQKHYVFNSSNTVDATLGKWREYNSGDSSSTTYATWDSNVDYKVGNVVLKDEVRYSCIADHTSTDFETDSINWIVILEQYYHVTQEQYNKMVSDGLITDSTKDLYIIDGNSEGGNSSSANYTSLEALGLTAPVSVGEIFNAMPDNTMAVLACEAKDETEGTVNISDIPESFGVLTIKRNGNGRFSIDYQNSLGSSPCNVKRWIGTLKGVDGTGLYWKQLSTQTTYNTLSDLGLTTDATINDIVTAMKDGTTFTYKTDVFDYATEYNNLQYATVTIYKQSTGMVQALMTDKNTGNLYVGRMDANNLFVGWRSSTFHRIVTQATAGYFKFKPTTDGGFEQPLRISVTDNYGGMIEISGNAPSQSQYKPFKCVRLSHGTYTDYNASNPANNKMEKLFYFDGYMYLKISSYTTATFTGLVGVPTFVETIDATAEEIPIVSAIATQYDGYGDPYIVTIGDSVSGDGAIQTLASLGLSTDIMTWKNGIYKVSHVSGLTGLPSDITNTSPGFRLEHHNIKKWNSNHNPNYQTWGQRHSVFYADNGNIYHRYYESGATAGTYIKDTGWNKIQTGNTKATLVTNTSTLKLDVTKKNASWYGAIKLTYLYDISLAEIEISFRSASDNLRWTHINGQKYINNITFTQDSSNTAHYTIGIEFNGTTYGNYQAEVIGDFADINSLTSESFTGANTAIYNAPWGKNNGVSLVSSPEDLGLTYPCTSVQLAQAMRNKFNVGVKCGAIGLFNCEGKASTITDAPSNYGLLHVETFGHDRILIRFDGIGNSSYDGSWIGQIKGSNGTFSSITWLKIDNNTYSTTEQPIGTWIDGKTIYRKVIQYTFASNATGIETQTTIGSVDGLDTLIKAEATIKRLDVKYDYHIPYGKNVQNHGYIVANTTGGSIILYDSSHSVNDKLYAIIEYTKQ